MILILQTYNTNITNDSRQSMNLNTFLSRCKTNTRVLYIDTVLTSLSSIVQLFGWSRSFGPPYGVCFSLLVRFPCI
jgi:hypothetical protein